MVIIMNNYQLPSASLLKSYQPDYAFLPNANFVSMHSVISSVEFMDEQTMTLPVALGRSLDGTVQLLDLAKASHLLIAGTDIARLDLSFAINSIITSLLFKRTPSEVQFVKWGSYRLNVYYKMLRPYFISDISKCYNKNQFANDVIPQSATNALAWLNWEFERRMNLLEHSHCHNLNEYNSLIINPRDHIPYLVVLAEDIISDINFWKSQAQKMVLSVIRKLLNNAQLAGIHFVFYEQMCERSNKILYELLNLLPIRLAFYIPEKGVCAKITGTNEPAQLNFDSGEMIYYNNGTLNRLIAPYMERSELVAVSNHVKEHIRL